MPWPGILLPVALLLTGATAACSLWLLSIDRINHKTCVQATRLGFAIPFGIVGVVYVVHLVRTIGPSWFP